MTQMPVSAEQVLSLDSRGNASRRVVSVAVAPEPRLASRWFCDNPARTSTSAGSRSMSSLDHIGDVGRWDKRRGCVVTSTSIGIRSINPLLISESPHAQGATSTSRRYPWVRRVLICGIRPIGFSPSAATRSFRCSAAMCTSWVLAEPNHWGPATETPTVPPSLPRLGPPSGVRHRVPQRCWSAE